MADGTLSAVEVRPLPSRRKTGPKPIPLRERFEAKVSPEPNTGCWLWAGAMDAKGYGSIGTGPRKTSPAHRVSYELNVGPIADGLHVCHRCDNPSCVNPAHLFLGTPDANMQDKVAKGRQVFMKGEESPLARLHKAVILQVRQLAESGISHGAIAKHLKISKSHVGSIVRRERWSHL